MMNTQLPVLAPTAKSLRESEMHPVKKLGETPNVHVEAGKNIKNVTARKLLWAKNVLTFLLNLLALIIDKSIQWLIKSHRN